MYFRQFPVRRLAAAALLAVAAFSAGCIKVKQERSTARLLATDTATQAQLVSEVNRFASVTSMKAKMRFQFEDNSFATAGSKEIYKSADGELVVQRPNKILLRVQVPVIKTDVAQMTSDGTSFRVAVLMDDAGGKYKRFVKGTNAADYSELEKKFETADLDDGGKLKKGVNAFKNLRPQHFTDAMLVRPTDEEHVYTMTTIFQEERDASTTERSPVREVVRGYYLLDEYAKNDDGSLKIARRFWFDRVGGIRLARQQIFDKNDEIESDIVYGKPGVLTGTGNYNNLPLQITVTRPKEKYAMTLTYQMPEDVTIGKTYPDKAFVLENSWGLDEVDLDDQLANTTKPNTAKKESQTGASRFQ